jgi:drug/metabolite transporter (DMT)-like permease
MSGETQQVARPAVAEARPSRHVDATLVGWMLLLTFLWGFNSITIKMVTSSIAPLMSAGLRGGVALAAVTCYGLVRGEPMGYRGTDRLHGLTIGLLFGLEFIFIYSGAPFTNGGHLSLFVNTAPIMVAGGAHFLLPGERMHLLKLGGLVLAFGGVILLFWDELYIQKQGYWRGDLLVLAGALAWAVTTLYMKRFMTGHFSGFRLLHAQILVSTPLLLGASLLTEQDALAGATPAMLGLIVFQGLVVVFFSYLAWMSLLTRYPASGMQSFTFLAPVWGVVAGVVLLSETVSLLMALGMTLIGVGIYLVNRPRKGTA